MIVRYIIFIPVWLLTLCLKPFLPAAHPWRHQKLTLRSWVEKGTENAFIFGFVFWVQGVSCVVLYLFWYFRR